MELTRHACVKFITLCSISEQSVLVYVCINSLTSIDILILVLLSMCSVSSSASAGHDSGKGMGVVVVVLLSSLVSTILIIGMVGAYKYWQKKKRERDQARFVKLFEDGDDIEDELGLGTIL